MADKKTYNVFTIVDNPNGEKNFWNKIGIGFLNQDNSINVQLNALPVNAKLQIRPKTTKDNQ